MSTASAPDGAASDGSAPVPAVPVPTVPNSPVSGPAGPGTAESASPVGSVDRALALLEILAAGGPQGLALREVTTRSGLSKGSAHRLLRALMHRRFVEQTTPDQHYRLGSAMSLLLGQFERGENLAMLMAPALTAISQQTQELVHLGRLEGPHVHYLDKVEPVRALRVWSRVGKEAPAARTAMGRAILAAEGVRGAALAPYAQVSDQTPDVQASATGDPAPARPVTAERLAEVVEEARTRGWAAEIEENEPGIACVGVALTRPGDRSIAVSVTGPIDRMGPERRAEIGALLRSQLTTLAPAGFAVAPTL